VWVSTEARTILLVEDEAIIALAEARLLAAAGYRVETAHSGERAVEVALADPRIDLVLMDIDLGRGIDGPEAARRILAARDLPLAFLSAHTEPAVVERTEGITSYGYIVKNSGETVLLASVRMAFRLHEARRSLRDREQHYRSLFQNAGGPVWVEDFSAFHREVETLRKRGFHDFRAWLEGQPGELFRFAELVRVVDLNDAARASVGLPPGSPTPPTLRPFLGPEAEDFFGEELCALAEGRTSFETEILVRPPGLEARRYFLRLDVVTGHEADLSRVHVVIHDLTEVRRAESELLEARRRASAVLDAIPDLMFAFTRAGVITDYRAPDPCLLAAPPDSIVGRRVEEVLPPELAELTMTMIAKVLGTGRPEVYEYGLTIGAPRRFQSRLVPMGDDACLALVREIEGA
jgi:CheY-like chemotaxis protein